MHAGAQCRETDLFFLSDHAVWEAGEGEVVGRVQPTQNANDVEQIQRLDITVFRSSLVSSYRQI